MPHDDDQDAFWRRSTQREDLELLRQYERERHRVGWRRNVLGALSLALLLWLLWFVLRW